MMAVLRDISLNLEPSSDPELDVKAKRYMADATDRADARFVAFPADLRGHRSTLIDRNEAEDGEG